MFQIFIKYQILQGTRVAYMYILEMDQLGVHVELYLKLIERCIELHVRG